MKNTQEKNEFLDVKDPRTTIESIRITKEAQKPKIVRVEQSSLLERARLFLPQLAEANSKLASQPKDKIDIENVDESQNGIIKMDLGLGVFDCIDPNSSNKDTVLPNKKDILDSQNLDLNIVLNPNDLPDDYTNPLIQMLSNNDSSSESESDSDSESDSSSDSDSDSSDSDVDMKDASNEEEAYDEDVKMKN